MRPYLWQSAALYIATAALLLLRPADLNLESVLNPLTDTRPSQIGYGLAFTAAAILAATAAHTRRPLANVAALAALAGVGIAWTIVTVIGAIGYAGDIGRPLLWAYVAILAAESLRYARLTPSDEEAMRELWRQYQEAKAEKARGGRPTSG